MTPRGMARFAHLKMGLRREEAPPGLSPVTGEWLVSRGLGDEAFPSMLSGGPYSTWIGGGLPDH